MQNRISLPSKRAKQCHNKKHVRLGERQERRQKVEPVKGSNKVSEKGFTGEKTAKRSMPGSESERAYEETAICLCLSHSPYL